MCGRYTAAKDFGELIKLVGIVMRVPFFARRYSIAPTHLAPVILRDHGTPAGKLMRARRGADVVGSGFVARKSYCKNKR